MLIKKQENIYAKLDQQIIIIPLQAADGVQ